MKNIILLFVLLFLNLNYSQNSYSIIYEADNEGQPITGSKEELLKYVQNGNPVRVGWVLKFKHPQNDSIIEMQHWADAGFITTLNNHVFTQISSIYQQGPSPSEIPSVFLVNNKPNGWVAIIGTTGVMRQKYTQDKEMIALMKKSGLSDEDIKKQAKELETMKVYTKWAVMKTKD